MKTKLLHGWNEVKFVESIEKEASSNKLKIQQTNYLKEGKYPIIDQSTDFIAGYTNDKSKIYLGKLPVVVFGDHTRIFKFVDFPFALGADGTKILVPKSDIKAKYFYYFLRNLKIESAGYSRHYKFLKEKKIIYPSLPIQEKIIPILENADKLKKLRDEADELTKDYLKAIFLKMFGDPVKNPKKWDVAMFSKLGDLSRGKSKHRPRNDPILLGGKYPLIQTGDVANSEGYITKFTQTYSELGLKQSRMWPKGTLCITIAANIAKTGILTFDACFPDSIVGFTPNDSTTTEYIQSWLSFLQRTLEDSAPESAQKNINLEILENLKVPLPPIELQNKFSRIVKSIIDMKKYQKDSKEHLDKMFGVLMQKAFKGEIVC